MAAATRNIQLLGIIGSLGVAGCGELLDIPSDPRLAADAAVPSGSSTSSAAPVQTTHPAGVEGNGGSSMTGLDSRPSDVPVRAGADEPVRSPPDAGAGGAAPVPDAALSPDAAVPAAPSCALPHVLGPNGNCFHVVAAPLEWDAARLQCRRQGDGWDLAVVRDASVDAFIAGLIDAPSWIGASDAAEEGAWVWVVDTAPFWVGSVTGSAVSGAYQNWYALDPNGGVAGNCARIIPVLGNAWADAECTELYGAVCEQQAQ